MARIKTFIDTGVFIAASRGDKGLKQLFALSLLADPAREIFTSSLVYLETLPYAERKGIADEVTVLSSIFAAAQVVHVSTAAVEVAYDLIRKLSVKTMDALHIAVAHEIGCDEFVTAEKRGRSMLFKRGLVT